MKFWHLMSRVKHIITKLMLEVPMQRFSAIDYFCQNLM